VIIARALAAAAIAVGLAAWVVFLRMGLVLAHYDAKAHLVVARRIFDNITPGWQQIGAIWLPLPHLIHALPTQLDLFYRTGAFASLVSVACLGVTTYAGARLVLLMTGSRLAACVAAALLVLNPNILYIHVTPMTEPLLLAAVSLVVLWLYEWVPLNQDSVPVRLRLALVAATWTRYEAWPVLAAALAAALYAGWRLGAAPGVIARRAWRLGVWPAAAVGLFMVNSRITVGDWLVSDGFYVPDPTYEGELLRSVLAVWWGTHELGTRVTEVIACAAAGFLVIRALTRAAAAPLLVPAALVAYGVLPALAFHAGHPFRIRYMLPAAACSALFAGVAVGFLRREAAAVLAGCLVGIGLIQSPPWHADAPLLAEAQWDRPSSDGRREVTGCLAAGYRGDKVMASMGSLAHYMQELSLAGFTIADFIHEGNGPIWAHAVETGPAPHAGWMLVEEQAEGGDVLARRIRDDPPFAQGMERVCDGGGVALYRRR